MCITLIFLQIIDRLEDKTKKKMREVPLPLPRFGSRLPLNGMFSLAWSKYRLGAMPIHRRNNHIVQCERLQPPGETTLQGIKIT